MKKSTGLKRAAMAMMAAGLLFGCGKNAETKVSKEEPSVSEELTATEETSAPEEGQKEETKGDIVTEEVENVSIRFYIGYNIASGDIVSDTIPCQTVVLTGEDLEKMAEMLPELTSVEPGSDTGEVFILDDYELTINEDLVIDIGREYGYFASEDKMIEIPSELYETIESIAQEYSDKEVYKTLDAKQITVVDSKVGRSYPISDPEQLENILAIKYYVINGDEKMFEDNDLAYVLDMDNGDSLFVFYAGVTGCLIHSNGACEYVNIRGMEDYLDTIITH